MRGRKPLPTQLHIIKGNPSKLDLETRQKTEPVFETSKLPCPRRLTGEARKEWQRIVPQLFRAGILTRLDRTALQAYCQVYGRWIEAEEQIKKHGVLIKSPQGFPMQSPYLAIANRCLEQIKSFLAEFGMTPSSRTRVKATAMMVPATSSNQPHGDPETKYFTRPS